MKKQKWVNKFEVVGIIPGIIVMPGIGSLDLSNENLPMDTVQKAFDAGCPYLKLIVDKPNKKQKSQDNSNEPEAINVKANEDVIREGEANDKASETKS